MRNLTLSLIIILLVSGLSTAQQTVTGIVYLDANKNSTFDSGEKTLPDVAVSNGSEVAITDKSGRYQLSVDNDEIIFVIKPSQYELPVNEFNLPQFYYIHKPDGSPELDFKGVEPTGPLPESVNFALWEGEMIKDYSILVFGDPQPYSLKEVDYFDRDISSQLEGVQGYEFGLSLGDIVGDDLELYPPYIKSVSKIGIPWFNVYGNHDMNYDVKDGEYADETWEATYGPATYSFNHGKVHYINLDDVIYPREDGRGGYIGGFTEKQLTFIENDLKYVPKDYLIILSFHIPLTYNPDYRNSFRQDDQKKLFKLLSDYPHTLTLSAHTHMQGIYFLDSTLHWQQETPHVHYNVGTTSGDWWSGVPDEDNIPPTIMRDGTENGYAMLHFEGNQYTIDYKAVRKDGNPRMNIWGPQAVPQNEWFNADVYVNYFLGNDSTQVQYRVKGETDWRPMQRVKIGDPFVTATRVKWDTNPEILMGKRPSNAVVSEHLWRVHVPNNLPEGEYVIEFKITDPLSGTVTGKHHYRIEAR